MSRTRPRLRIGRLGYTEILVVDVDHPAQLYGQGFAWGFADPAGDVLGLYRQPGLAESEQIATEAQRV